MRVGIEAKNRDLRSGSMVDIFSFEVRHAHGSFSDFGEF
jgi:hypothetical protein